ncbi:cell-cycle control medial ring component-domain-containing protein [Durotheca rogersii]|uniref:cell-cycle control medial ring component-domain-containing protein n=1 Tax=Durotheca rogersii TaxID=419775 RepID=UPI0022204B8A|nr:cell-cycle control medial ring component-domain-containing protein [Durotheca rogersii]KAI5864195.1 cell-cycle control medial ring component-domain-containing protein [Durotheca rogersii]
MAEVAFAKFFLAGLDARPMKLSPDHVEDPKTYAARSPYILPRMPRPMRKRTNVATAAPRPHGAVPGHERRLAVVVKSLRNPPLEVRLPPQDPATSVLDIRAAVARQTGVPADKLRLLHAKKPVADSKALRDLVAPDAAADAAVEFSVMVLGGASTLASAHLAEKAQASGAQTKGADVLRTKEFWDDLRGFLTQRIRDEKTATELTNVFQAAWKART